MNGGYTVGEWSPTFKLFWELKVLTNITAHFITPSQGKEFTQGEKIRWSITYTGYISSQSLSWWEFGDINSNLLKIGRQPIIAGYGTNQRVEVIIKTKRRLGLVRNEYDDIIFEEAEEFKIDPDLLKSLIHQESLSPEGGTYHFKPNAYRYEPCIDYNYFSKINPSIGMTQEPYNHFTIRGKNLKGDNIPEGDKVSTLEPSYKQMIREGVLKKAHILKFDDNDPDLTLTELWRDNDAIQRWSRFIDPNSDWCRDLLIETNRNFTVQFLLTGSYGLSQVLYQTAIVLGFNQEKPNRSPYDLFIPDVGIHYGAKRLKKCYDTYKNWRTAVRCYNGSVTSEATEKYAKDVYDTFYLSNLYDLIIE